MLGFQLDVTKFIPSHSIFKGNQSTDTYYFVKKHKSNTIKNWVEDNLSMKNSTYCFRCKEKLPITATVTGSELKSDTKSKSALILAIFARIVIQIYR